MNFNIEDLSPDFIESLTDDQRMMLLKSIAEKAQSEPEIEEIQQHRPDQNEYVAPTRAKIKVKNEAVKWQGNQWVDEGTESKGEDFETPKIKLANRIRKAPTYKSVTCNLCHEKFEKRSEYVFGTYHVCDQCGKKR